jgi:hypothetical protein
VKYFEKQLDEANLKLKNIESLRASYLTEGREEE